MFCVHAGGPCTLTRRLLSWPRSLPPDRLSSRRTATLTLVADRANACSARVKQLDGFKLQTIRRAFWGFSMPVLFSCYLLFLLMPRCSGIMEGEERRGCCSLKM
ncbi:hypothetical protein K469DRAFT_173117 [Zopfia rhizophila CBS 207.26]|uniref:Uncharacterized protein n=1 Tax=Zopfia rhizophila CBS 207.26 TaxID=1314779 RepID=A0A6A6D942_9PEZI|nr:hypothetical protein K469DRAFT_173117 [Zopfia rhizophila CBS 207.26]